MNNAGRVAIVTGSSKGIGAGIAERLAADGAAVVVNYSRSDADADAVVRRIVANGGQAVAFKADLSRPAEIKPLVDHAIERFGRLDVLVNNAGIDRLDSLDTLSADSFDAHFFLNVRGLLLMTQAAARVMGPGSVIVNISSGLAKSPYPIVHVYNATKHGGGHADRSLGMELGPHAPSVSSASRPPSSRPRATPIRAQPRPTSSSAARRWVASGSRRTSPPLSPMRYLPTRRGSPAARATSPEGWCSDRSSPARSRDAGRAVAKGPAHSIDPRSVRDGFHAFLTPEGPGLRAGLYPRHPFTIAMHSRAAPSSRVGRATYGHRAVCRLRRRCGIIERSLVQTNPPETEMKNNVMRLMIPTLTAALMTTPAMAQSIKQKDMIAHDREKVSTLAKEANQACGTQIAFQVDYPSYAHVLDDDNNQRPWAYLANATDAFKQVCRSDAGKQAIQAKIKSVQVSNGQSETESLANGVFRYQVPFSGHSPATVVTWLQSNL